MATITDRISYSQSNYFWTARSRTFVEPDDGTYAIFQVAESTLVSQIFVLISTAYVGGTPEVTVGWAGNQQTAVAAGFMSNDIFKPKETGLKVSMADTKVSYQGKYFNAGSGIITVTVANNSASTLGKFIVLMNYSVVFG